MYFPALYCRTLLVTYFILNSVYMLIPDPFLPVPFGKHKIVLYVSKSILFYK